MPEQPASRFYCAARRREKSSTLLKKGNWGQESEVGAQKSGIRTEAVIPSGARNLALIRFPTDQGEIPRSARNDNLDIG